MKKIGKLTKHKAIDPKGVCNKGEYHADMMQKSGRNAKPSKGGKVKAALIDGPFGGRNKA